MTDTIDEVRETAALSKDDDWYWACPENTHLITRHPGAIEWLRSRGIDGDVIEHFSIDDVVPGDRYVGILPINLIIEVLRNGAEFILLIMPNLPTEARGQELTSDMMDEFGAELRQIDEIETSAWSG